MRGMDFSQKHDTARYVKILELLIPIFICHVYGIQIDLIPVQSMFVYRSTFEFFVNSNLWAVARMNDFFGRPIALVIIPNAIPNSTP